MDIKPNISRLLTRIPSRVHLVVVVKSATLDQIKEVLSCPVADLAFNSYQQLAAINKLILKDFRRHFIGHIQTKKAKKIILEKPYLIQSVDSLKIAKKLDESCKELNHTQDILLQIKTDEDQEYGFYSEELREIMFKIESELKNLNIRGLMAIPASEDKGDTRKTFQEMKNLFNETEETLGRKLDYLSMGTSKNYVESIQEGSNMVQIGSAIFS